MDEHQKLINNRSNNEIKSLNQNNQQLQDTSKSQQNNFNLLTEQTSQQKINDISRFDNDLQFHNKKLTILKKLDALPLSKWHMYVIASLGITWIFDGYEVSMLSLTASDLQDYFLKEEDKIGLIASFYLMGCVTGSLFFGFMAGKIGRKSLFDITLLVYFISVIGISIVDSYEGLLFFRFMTGVGVGGEYASIFVVIDEIVPSMYRGRIDIILDGTWHLGSLIASATTLVLYRFNHEDVNLWRYLFLVGGIGVIPVFWMRKVIPESPRWLLLQNRIREAEAIVQYISECVNNDEILKYKIENRQQLRDKDKEYQNEFQKIDTRNYIRQGFFLSLILMVSQAFFFNGIFYTFSLILKAIYLVDKQDIGYFMMPLSLASFAGTVLLSKYFDTLGRRKMILFTYTGSGILLLLSGFFFKYDMLNLNNQFTLWFLVFLIASPGASAAHLTVSEIFPSEMRSQMMAIFFSLGLSIGGVFSPYIFGILIKTKSREEIFKGYLLSSLLMIFAGIFGFFFGVDAENKSLEEIQEEDRQYEASLESEKQN